MLGQLVIHIGDPKTGSTSIQTAMQTGACSCDSPTFAVQPELNARSLAIALKSGDDPDRIAAEFARKADWAARSRADIGIISSESLSAARPAQMQENLVAHMPALAGQARIIAYVRPHAARILSIFGQRSKVGAFNGDLTAFTQAQKTAAKMTYAPRFTRWRDVFGDRFILRPFIRSEMHDQDVVADFFHTALRGAPFRLSAVITANETLTLPEIAAMQVVQSALEQHGLNRPHRNMIGLAMGQALAARTDRARVKPQLDKANAETIRAAYLKDARALDQAFFSRPLMETALDQAVAEARPDMLSSAAEDWFAPDDIAQLRTLSAEMASHISARPRAWRTQYMQRAGLRGDGADKSQNRKQQKTAATVWDLLDQLAQIMTTARPA